MSRIRTATSRIHSLKRGVGAEDYYAGKEEGSATRFKQQGVGVGWLVDSELFLDPDASYAAVQRFARDQNESFTITANALRKRIKEKGWLASTDESRGKLTVRKTLLGARREVLHITKSVLPMAPEIDPDSELGPKTGAGSGQEKSRARIDAAQKTAVTDISGHSGAAFRPEMGRMGQSVIGEETSTSANYSQQNTNHWGGWQ